MSIKPLLSFIILVIGIVAILVGMTIYISPSDSLEKADVIVAISGGDTEARTREAIRLYHEGWAPHLLFSGAALDPLSPSNAQVMRDIAESEGVPLYAIDIAERAGNTAENAAESQVIIDEFDYSKVILVTSPYHQRRAYMEFRNRFGDDVDIINHPVEDDSDWSRQWWWRTPKGWWLTLGESVKVPLTALRNL